MTAPEFEKIAREIASQYRTSWCALTERQKTAAAKPILKALRQADESARKELAELRRRVKELKADLERAYWRTLSGNHGCFHHYKKTGRFGVCSKCAEREHEAIARLFEGHSHG